MDFSAIHFVSAQTAADCHQFATKSVKNSQPAKNQAVNGMTFKHLACSFFSALFA